jgi:hypothetical protein
MGGPGGPRPPGGGVAGVEPPLRGVPEAVGWRQGGDFPPPEYASHFLCRLSASLERRPGIDFDLWS